MKRILLAEGIATALLVGIGLGSVHVAVLTGSLGLPAVAACWGGAVVLLIAVAGPISGAHANPAVTMALAAMGRFPWRRVAPYLLAQFVGALVAAGLLHLMFVDMHAHQALVRGVPLGDLLSAANTERWPHPAMLASVDLPWWKAALAEGGGAGLILAAVVAVSRRSHPPALTPVVVGLAVALAIVIFAPISQAGFNPARDFAPRLVACCAGADGGFTWAWFPVYVLAPIVGATAAGFLVAILDPVENA